MEEELIFWNSTGQIVPNRLYEFFERKGIGKYFTNEANRKNTESIIVKVSNNIVSQINIEYLLEITKEYIQDNTTDLAVRGNIISSLLSKTALYSDKTLKLLNAVSLEFISDNKDTAYLFFKNGIVEIDKKGHRLRPYTDFSQHVWEGSIIPIDFSELEAGGEDGKSDFSVFLEDLCHVTDSQEALKRKASLMSAIGYLLHRYKNPAKTKAIVFMDTYINMYPNGGSGKTLLMNSIGKVRRLSILDGKMYDQKEWFALSSVDHETEVLLFDDIDAHFKFEDIFPLITTGMLVRQKYKNHTYIKFDKAPKIALTTNYALLGDGSSHKRRKFEFEVSPTYSADFSPRDKFGRNFFDEWEANDWNHFYHVMISCLHLFLENGLLEPIPINLYKTKLISSSCEEFVEWADEKLVASKKYDKKSLYDSFILNYPEYRSRVKQKEFTGWLRIWGGFKNYQVYESHSGMERNIIFDINPQEIDENLKEENSNRSLTNIEHE